MEPKPKVKHLPTNTVTIYNINVYANEKQGIMAWNKI